MIHIFDIAILCFIHALKHSECVFCSHSFSVVLHFAFLIPSEFKIATFSINNML